MKVFNSAISDLCLPQVAYNSSYNQNNVISFCGSSPDAKCSLLRRNFKVERNLLGYDLSVDNPLTTSIKSCQIDANGRFGFMTTEIEDFSGKQLPAEAEFVKLNCTVFDLGQSDGCVIEQFSYIVRKASRYLYF